MAGGFTGRIFFYCFPQGPPEKAAYQHSIVCLAEGLKALGVEFYSNINYWQISPEEEKYLFCHDPRVTPDGCSIAVLNDDCFSYGKPFPKNLFHAKRKYITVYMDHADGVRTHAWGPEFRQFDIILKAHYNSKCRYPSNFHPWAYGLSNRILRETEVLSPFQDRKRHLLFNFRVKHSLRETIREEFLPHIQSVLPIDDTVDGFDHLPADSYHYLQWAQTGRRHYPSYYQRLKESAACACFGGRFMSPWPRGEVAPVRLWHRILNKLAWRRSKPIVSWDSWRFWESLAAGCVALHVDFEKYGLFLPVMPENWRHYVGIDLDNMQEAVDRMANDPGILERIATEGRLWALEHYSPVPTALRFLETIRKRLS